jgi:hypothetical protein
MLDVDFVAKRYGVLPSQIAKMDIADFQLDLLVAVEAETYTQKMNENARKGANMIR